MSKEQKLTVANVRKSVNAIERMKDDGESAHIAENTLHYKVLGAIAEGRTDDAAGIAREALETTKIKFARWYS